MGELCREYQTDFSKCIKEKASQLGYDIFLFASFGAYTSTTLYDAGERDIIRLPDFSRFEGVIVLNDTFDINGMEEMLLDRLAAYPDLPVISVRNRFGDHHLVKFNDYETTVAMTNHFLDVHRFTRICYMSGPLEAPDAVIRKQAFLDTMEKAGISLPPEAVFTGDYWNFLSVPATAQFLTAFGDELPQAIICANDYMAMGIADELKKQGYRIPEDICISGCDDIIEGNGYRPSITTVKMPVREIALEAIELIGRIRSGDMDSRNNRNNNVTQVCGNILLKGSCGCCKDEFYFDPSPMVNLIREDFVSIRQASLVCTDVLNCISEEEKLQLLDSYFYRTNLKRAHLFLCVHSDNEGDEKPVYTDIMRHVRTFPLSDEINTSPSCGIRIDKSDIIPQEFISDEPQFFTVFPLHNKNNTYGYLVGEVDDNYVSPFISAITNAIADAYEDLRIQEQFAEFTLIKQQNQHDSLTGLFNRRGFEQHVSNYLSSNSGSSGPLSFISVDMDSLKQINDTYGHLEGDEAIKLFANMLKGMLSENDIVGRVGGDEFQILLTSPDIREHEMFISRAMVTIAMKNDLIDKPYTIHASFGAFFSSSSKVTSSLECIQIADKRMYEQKRLYKASLKKAPR